MGGNDNVRCVGRIPGSGSHPQSDASDRSILAGNDALDCLTVCTILISKALANIIRQAPRQGAFSKDEILHNIARVVANQVAGRLEGDVLAKDRKAH